MKITDKWEIKEFGCRRCKHLISLKKGAKNVKGEWMGPEDYWFTIECKMEGKAVVRPHLGRKKSCPFFEVK